jgi:pentatricopeptide repeat protein
MRKRGVDEAWNHLEEMQRDGVATDKYTVSRMLMKTVGDGRSRMNPARIYRGIGLVEKFIELQPKDVDEVLLNALLDTCCRLKDLTRLEAIMQRMRDLKITPSPVTLGILVKTYGQAGDIQKVLQVWDEMEKQRGQANAVTFGCMIDACVKCNHLSKGVEIFKGMRESGKHRNTILYTTLIKGYGLDKDLKSAMELFREMPQEGVPYNTITYNSIIDACVKSGDLATAEQLLQEITAPNSPLEPDLITFSTLLKGYCHGGELDKALQVAEAIKSRGLRCDELVYNTLMDGCVKANDVTAGVGLFEEMVHNGMRPSAITHSILSRLYQRAGYEEDASEAVAQLYQHHGIERPTGGERGKGAGRRDDRRHDRRHGGPSPTASPMSGYGMHQEQNNWNPWGDMGYDGYTNQSGASTPCGSPHHQIGGQGNGLFLPMDAMRGMPPPFPGTSGSETPYGSSFADGTPIGSGYGVGSPCMSPMGMDQQQQQQHPGYMAQGSPGQMLVTAPPLPPFPFAAQGGCTPQSNTPGMDAPQFFPVPVANSAPGTMPGMAHLGSMVQASGPAMTSTQPDMGPCMNQVPMANGGFGGSPTSFIGSNPIWQYQPQQQQQQSPFPMPLSPPHDLAQSCATIQPQQQPQQQQQAFFEVMSDNGQARGGQNPFCL